MVSKKLTGDILQRCLYAFRTLRSGLIIMMVVLHRTEQGYVEPQWNIWGFHPKNPWSARERRLRLPVGNIAHWNETTRNRSCKTIWLTPAITNECKTREAIRVVSMTIATHNCNVCVAVPPSPMICTCMLSTPSGTHKTLKIYYCTIMEMHWFCIFVRSAEKKIKKIIK